METMGTCPKQPATYVRATKQVSCWAEMIHLFKMLHSFFFNCSASSRTHTASLMLTEFVWLFSSSIMNSLLFMCFFFLLLYWKHLCQHGGLYTVNFSFDSECWEQLTSRPDCMCAPQTPTHHSMCRVDMPVERFPCLCFNSWEKDWYQTHQT